MTGLVGTINRWFGGGERERVLLLGDEPRVRLLAAELGTAGKPISWIRLNFEDGDFDLPGVNLIYGAEPWEDSLARAGAEQANCQIASTANTDFNQKISRIARDKFQLPNAVLGMCLVSGVTSWARLTDNGMARMEWRDVLHTACADGLSSQLIARLAKLDERDRIVDLELRSPAVAGRPISALPLNDCEVLGVTRKGAFMAMLDVNQVELNDVVTVTGATESVDKLREVFTTV